MAMRAKLVVFAPALVVAALTGCGKNSQPISFPEREISRPRPDTTEPQDSNEPQDAPVVKKQKDNSSDYSDDVIADNIASLVIDGSKQSSGADWGVGIINHVFGVTRTVKAGKTYVSSRNATCTATLLDTGDIITAAHCIDKRIREGAENCHDIVFRHKKLPDFYRCNKIVWYSKKYTFGDTEPQRTGAVPPDVLIFSLQKKVPNTIRGLKLATRAASSATSLAPWMYTPHKIVVDEEANKTNTVYTFSDEQSCPLTDKAPAGYPFRILTCHSAHGNSGAPVVNERNEIQMILKGFIGGNDEEVSPTDETLVTDVSCVRQTAGGYAWNPACEEYGRFYQTETP